MADSQCAKLAEKVFKTLETTLGGLVLTVAYQVGVIEALIEAETPRTPQEIADSKNLKERYTSELLKCLACNNFIQVQKKDGALLYNIPKDLKSAFDSRNALFRGFVATSAVNYENVVQCFQNDGPYGMSHPDDPMTMETFAMISRERLGVEFQLILDSVPGLKGKLESGIDVIDIGCGKGELVSLFARRFPNSRFTASDVSNNVLKTVQQSVTSENLKNVRTELVDILDVPDSLTSKYDFVYVNRLIHCLTDPEKGIAGLHKLLKPGSFMVMIDVATDGDVFNNPQYLSLSAANILYCIPHSYQSASAKSHGCLWSKDTVILYLERQGFKVVQVHKSSAPFLLFACQKV